MGVETSYAKFLGWFSGSGKMMLTGTYIVIGSIPFLALAYYVSKQLRNDYLVEVQDPRSVYPKTYLAYASKRDGTSKLVVNKGAFQKPEEYPMPLAQQVTPARVLGFFPKKKVIALVDEVGDFRYTTLKKIPKVIEDGKTKDYQYAYVPDDRDMRLFKAMQDKKTQELYKEDEKGIMAWIKNNQAFVMGIGTLAFFILLAMLYVDFSRYVIEKAGSACGGHVVQAVASSP